MQPILDSNKAKVYYDGIFSNPRLQHPEGVALDNDGFVYCGTENGEIMKIEKDKSKMECLASSGGFILGIAIDINKNVFACEMKEAALFKYDSEKKTFKEFAKGPKIPNYPVIDKKRNCIYVSDSFGFNEKGIGLYKFDLTSGEGGPCSEELFNFANGMCLSPDGNYLYVVESFHPCVSRLPINDDGSFGKKEIFRRTFIFEISFSAEDRFFLGHPFFVFVFSGTLFFVKLFLIGTPLFGKPFLENRFLKNRFL